jgi:hypothetical protein
MKSVNNITVPSSHLVSRHCVFAFDSRLVTLKTLNYMTHLLYTSRVTSQLKIRIQLGISRTVISIYYKNSNSNSHNALTETQHTPHYVTSLTCIHPFYGKKKWQEHTHDDYTHIHLCEQMTHLATEFLSFRSQNVSDKQCMHARDTKHALCCHLSELVSETV